MTKQTETNPMVHLVEEFTEAVVASQEAGLRLLQAEMAALTQVLPGAPAHSEEERIKVDAEVEASFDNMPI